MSGVALGFHGVTVAYRREPVLVGIETSIPAGSLCAVVGPNGAGKSTLVKAALGLVPLAQGSIEILGRPVFDFFFVAVEKCEPFGVAVYRISDAAAGLGQDETLEDLRRLNGCLIDNKWPNIEPTLREIGVPSWYGKGGAS